jgi:hypothetical protein
MAHLRGRLGRARCTSLRPGGRSCWRRVPSRGARCDRCWTDLAGSPTVSDRAELAKEADLPGWVAELLTVDLEAMVRVLLAERGDLDGHVLARLAGDRDAAVRATAAANPACPADVQSALAADTEPLVALAVAGRPDVPPALLDELAGHGDARVRGAVAANPAAGEAVERHLACRDGEESVLMALAAKPSTAPVVRGWLTRHPSPAVAQLARRCGGRHGGIGSPTGAARY